MRKIFVIIVTILSISLYADANTNDIPCKLSNIETRNLREIIGGYAWDLAIVDSELQVGPLTISTSDGNLANLKEDTEQFIAGADWYKSQWIGCQYETNAIVSIDPVTGDKSVIGTMDLPENSSCTGLTYQANTDNFYVSVYESSTESSKLYSLDIDSANVIEVGTISDSLMVIGIASDNDGNIYGIDTFEDILISINPEDATFSTIGELGVGINYAQDIAYDRDQNKLYGTLYNINAGTFHEINTETGAATQISAYGDEIAGFAIPYTCDVQYTISGTVKNHDNNEVISGAEVEVGCYKINTNDSGNFNLSVNPGNYTIKITADGYSDLLQLNNNIQSNTDLSEFSLNPIEQLEPPTNLTYSIEDQNTTITWDASSSTGVEYIIYRNHTEIASTTQLTYTDENLSDGYHIYYIKSSDGDNSESDKSLDVSVRIGEPIDAPLSLEYSYNESENSVTLNWQAPEHNVLFESFENEFPPNGWTRLQKNQNDGKFWTQFETVTWSSQSVVPTDGQYQAGVKWGNQGQDEWLITPEILVSGNLSFDFYGKYGSTANDHYYVKVSTDKGATWTALWDASTQTGENTYTAPVNIDLSDYQNQLVKLAWHIVDGDNQGAWYSTFIDKINIGSEQSRNLVGYKVYRNSEEIVELDGTTLSYTDQDIQSGQQYTYHITAIYDSQESEASNSVEISTVANEDVNELITEVSNYPNPFIVSNGRNSEMTISFSLERPSEVKIDVFNTKGQFVKTLVTSKLKTGNHNISWNGMSDNGKEVSCGIYMYKITTDSKTLVKKLLLVK
jgi:Fe-S cluster assembly iron-binding protein IscA